MSRFKNFITEAPEPNVQKSISNEARALYSQIKNTKNVDQKIDILARLVLLAISMGATDKGVAMSLK